MTIKTYVVTRSPKLSNGHGSDAPAKIEYMAIGAWHLGHADRALQTENFVQAQELLKKVFFQCFTLFSASDNLTFASYEDLFKAMPHDYQVRDLESGEVVTRFSTRHMKTIYRAVLTQAIKDDVDKETVTELQSYHGKIFMAQMAEPEGGKVMYELETDEEYLEDLTLEDVIGVLVAY